MKDYKLRDLRASHTLGWRIFVVLQKDFFQKKEEKKTEAKNEQGRWLVEENKKRLAATECSAHQAACSVSQDWACLHTFLYAHSR
jgi:hypothetical protein